LATMTSSHLQDTRQDGVARAGGVVVQAHQVTLGDLLLKLGGRHLVHVADVAGLLRRVAVVPTAVVDVLTCKNVTAVRTLAPGEAG